MFKNPFSFKGRISRTEYGFSVAVFVLLLFLLDYLTESMIRVGKDLPLFAYTIIVISMWWFYLAQGAKRAHDIGISGWLGAIHFFLMMLLIYLPYGIYDQDIYDTLIGVTFFLNFLFFVVKEGELGSNKWGDDPKGVGNTSQSGGGFTPPNNPQYPTGGYQNGNNFGGYNGGYNNQQQGGGFYNGGHNANPQQWQPQGQQPQGGGFYNGGHNANPQQWQQQGQQPQGGGFYNGGHNANPQQWQPQQTPPQPKRGDGKDFDGDLYDKAK